MIEHIVSIELLKHKSLEGGRGGIKPAATWRKEGKYWGGKERASADGRACYAISARFRLATTMPISLYEKPPLPLRFLSFT